MSLYKTLKGKTTYTQDSSLYRRLKDAEKAATLGNVADFRKLDEASVKQYKADEQTKDIQQFLYKQGLRKLDDKYKGLNPLARANSPEYKSDLINLAKTTGYYDADAKEPAKMYNTEATKKVIPYLGEKAKMGLMDFGAGLTKLNEIGKSGDRKTLTPAQRMQVQQDIDKAAFQKAEQENVSPALQKVGNVVGATTAMIPNIMLSAVNPTMGLAQLGLSAAGTSAHQAMTENASKGQAMAYGALSGGIEVGTEKLFGGLPFMKGVGDKVAGKLIDPIKNKVIKAGVKWVMNMGEEALEEGIAGVLDPFAKRLTYDKDAPMATLAEIGEQMLMGAAVSAILGIPGTVIDSRGKQTPTIQNIKSVDDGIVTFTMADGSTLELDPSQMEYEDIETVERAIPDDTKLDLTKKAKAAFEEGKAAAEKRNEAAVQLMENADKETMQEQPTKSEAKPTTIAAGIGKQTPVKNIDDYIRGAQNKVDDLRYQRNELGALNTDEIETAEKELLRLQKKKYLPYYKEQLASLEKTQKEIFERDNDITPEFVDTTERIEKLKGRIAAIEADDTGVSAEPAKAETANETAKTKAEPIEQTKTETGMVETPTQTVEAETGAGQVNLPPKTEAATGEDVYTSIYTSNGNNVRHTTKYGSYILTTDGTFERPEDVGLSGHKSEGEDNYKPFVPKDKKQGDRIANAFKKAEEAYDNGNKQAFNDIRGLISDGVFSGKMDEALDRIDEVEGQLAKVGQEGAQKDYPGMPKATTADIEAIEEEFFGHKLLKIDLQKFAEKVLSAKEKLLAEFKKEKAAIRWMAKERQTAALDRLSQKYDTKIDKLNKLLDAEKYKNFWKSELDKKDLRDRISQLRTDKNQQITDMKKAFSEKLKETKKEYTLKKHEAIGKLKEKIRDKAAEDRVKAAERKEINRKLKKLRGLDTKHMRPEYKKQIEAILSTFDITAKRHTNKKLIQLQRIKSYIEQNPDHTIPDYVLKQLDMLGKKTVSQITLEEFNNIYDSIMHLAHLEKLKNMLIMKERYRNAAEIASEASEGILENRKIRVDPTAIDTNKPEFSKNIFKEFFHNHLNPETLTVMSEQRENGILKKILYDDMYEGHSNEVRYKQEAYKIFESFLEGLGSDIRSWSRSFNKSLKDSELVEIPISKQPKQTIDKIRITKAERLYLYLASQDADAKRSMLRGGVSFGANLSQIVRLTEADLKTIADSMTKEEKQFAALVDKYFGDFARIRMNEAFLELNGYELIPQRKGYVPIKRHQDFLDRDYLKMRNKNVGVSLEGMGVLKERVKSSTPIVADDIFRVLVEHIEKVGAYTGLAKPLRNAKMLLENPKLKNAYRQVGMYNIHGQLNKYIQDIESKSVDLEFIDKLGYSIQNKFASSALGLNPFTILKQFSAYALEANEIPVKYLVKAQFTKTVYDEIRKYSPILAERAAGNVSLELGEIGRIARIRRLFGNYKDIPQLLTKGIVAADKQIIGKTWNAAKAMIKEQNPHLTEEQVLERTARKTEEVVRHTNSASTMYDRSSIARSRSLFTRAATMFTSQTNIMFNSSVRAVLEYNQSDKTAKDFGIATKKLVTILVIANVMEQAVDQLRNKIKGKEDDEDRWNIPLDILEGILNQVYFVGKAFSAYRSKIKFGKFAGYDLTISQFQVVNQIIDYATDLTALVEQVSSKERYKSGVNKGKMKWKKTLSGLTDETFSILSRIAGLPYDSVKGIINGIKNKVE